MDGNSLQRHQIHHTIDGVYRLEFEVPWPPYHVAAYLVDGAEPILIDAGGPSDDAPAELPEALAAIDINPEAIEHVLVTHPHTDHIGKVPELREAGAEVYAVHPAITQLRRQKSVLEASVRHVGREIGYDGNRLEAAVEEAKSSLQRNRQLLNPEKTHSLAYEVPYTIGTRQVTAFRTPGHQIHHASFQMEVDGTELLFSGDAIIEPFRAAALHTGLDYGAFEAIDAFYLAMDRFERLDVDCVCPGHGPVFSDLPGAVESTREALDELVAESLEAVDAAEPATPVEITKQQHGEIKYSGQLLDLVGALGTLEHRGDVTYELEDGVRKYRRL